MFIYKYTNNINGKVYIGLTTRTVEKRHSQHLNDINDGGTFHNALKKYGVNNFTLETLLECGDFEELKKAEKSYIRKFNSFANGKNPNGYNLTLGGEGTWGFKHSDEVKLGLSMFRKDFYKNNSHPSTGLARSEESKILQRQTMTGKYDGEKNPYYGKVHSAETKKRLGTIARERFAEGKHPRLGVKLSEEQKKAIGLFHKGKTISPEQRAKQSEMLSGEKNHAARKILCVTTGEVFNYMGEASEKYKLDRSNLTKCCKGKTKWCGVHPLTNEKLIWSYI